MRCTVERELRNGAGRAGAGSCGAGLSVPPAPDDSALAERQAQAFVEAMRPRRPGRQAIAIVALNGGTEMTNLLRRPVKQLDRTLCEIAERFGEAPRGRAGCHGVGVPGRRRRVPA